MICFKNNFLFSIRVVRTGLWRWAAIITHCFEVPLQRLWATPGVGCEMPPTYFSFDSKTLCNNPAPKRFKSITCRITCPSRRAVDCRTPIKHARITEEIPLLELSIRYMTNSHLGSGNFVL